MAVGSAGFFLQYLDILSWLTLGDSVEPRVSAGERKGIDVTPFALAYAKSQVKVPCARTAAFCCCPAHMDAQLSP